MLKRFRSLGIIILTVICVLLLSSSASASSAGPVIYQVQVGPTGIADKEFITVYNNSTLPIEVTGWCLKYGATSSVDTGLPLDTASLGCLAPPNSQTKLWLDAHSYLVAASNAFKADYTAAVPPVIFDISFASGSIAAKDRFVRLIDANSVEVDRLGWGTGVAEGVAVSNPVSPNILQRINAENNTLQDTDNNQADFISLNSVPILESGVYEEETPIDLCQNIDGIQEFIPDGYENIDGLNCTLIPPPLEAAPLLITEMLPNATSFDSGKEFIELYNPNTKTINLKDYVLEFETGPSKSFTLPEQTLAPGGYVSFSDTQTSITLPNTTASLRLIAPAGNIVDTTIAYDTPADNMAWAVIGDTWQYTNQPTPGAANIGSIQPGVGGGGTDSANGLEPCAPGKFRNPETNRCKNIESEETSLKPCAADQVRNPETNRCRSIFSTGSSLTPCQPGQERNPATNRCRSVATNASASLKPCAANQERNLETNRCRKKASNVAADEIKDVAAKQIGENQSGWLLAGGVAAAAAGYGAWEWRSEVTAFGRRLKELFGKSPPTD